MSEEIKRNSVTHQLQQAKSLLKKDLHNDSYAIDAEILLSHCLNKSVSYLFTWPDKLLSTFEQEKFQYLLKQRMQGHPIAYLIGYREFWSLEFQTTPHVLIPRPETECMVEWVLTCMADKKHPYIADLGTGSGAIAISLAHERKDAILYASDISSESLKIATANAFNNKVHSQISWVQSDWFMQINPNRQFDMIVSNPPYIEKKDPHLQQGDLRFEPLHALASGENGLDAIQTIISNAKNYLKPNAYIVLEHGYQQASAVRQLLHTSNYRDIITHKDLQQHERFTSAQWSHSE